MSSHENDLQTFLERIRAFYEHRPHRGPRRNLMDVCDYVQSTIGIEITTADASRMVRGAGVPRDVRLHFNRRYRYCIEVESEEERLRLVEMFGVYGTNKEVGYKLVSGEIVICKTQ